MNSIVYGAPTSSLIVFVNNVFVYLRYYTSVKCVCTGGQSISSCGRRCLQTIELIYSSLLKVSALKWVGVA